MSAQKVPTVSLDTSTVPAEQRLGLWQRVIPSHILTAVGDPASFAATGQTWLLGPTILTYSTIAPLRYRRDEAQIAADGIDHLVIMLMKRGEFTGTVSGESLTVGAGEIFLQDLSRPMDVEASYVESITIRMPRIAADFAQSAKLNGLCLAGPLARFLAEQLQSLIDRMDSLTVAEATSQIDKCVELATAAIRAQLGVESRRRSSPAASARMRARRYVDAHLTSDKLTPDRIAKAIGVPRSTLYLAFDGGIAAYIKRRRLDAAHVLLNDRKVSRSINDIAHEYGFATSAHFSRAFREEYGYPPSDVRSGKENLFGTDVDDNERAAIFTRWLARLNRS